MNKLLKLLSLSFFVTISLLGCREVRNQKEQPNGSLENTSWLLVRFSDLEVSGPEITLNFGVDKLNGKAVCNNYFSKYTLNETKMTVEPIGATRMLCPENAKLEIDYFNFFSMEFELELGDRSLILKNELGTLEFSKVNRAISSVILREEALGVIPLGLGSQLLIEGFKDLFPSAKLKSKTVEMVDGPCQQIVFEGSDRLLEVTFASEQHILKRLEIVSTEIRDQFGVRVGMALAKAKILRPKLKVETDAQFHTYARAGDSKIRYELRSKPFQGNKTDWTFEEIKEWKIKTIIWERSKL